MKQLFVILISLNTLLISSQEIVDFGFGGSRINFEDTSEYKFVKVDTNNVWIITEPKKQILFLPTNPSYLGKFAIISDTNEFYPVNIKSSFQFKLKLMEGCDGYTLAFSHKYDFESYRDGGIIETSFDNGMNWQNILHDSVINSNLNHVYGLYNLVDTIHSFNNQPGFTGLQSEINNVSISFWSYGHYYLAGDTMLLRFTIKSDSVNNNHEGWMLDEFIFGGFLVEINEIDSDNSIYVYPTPSNDIIYIKYKNEAIKIAEIISLNGETVFKSYNNNIINTEHIPKGFYLLKINNNHIRKIIIK